MATLSTFMQKSYMNSDAIDYITCGVVINHMPVPTGDLISKTALCVLLDISGSMEGEKLTTAKAALNYLLDRMDETNTISVITFSDNVEEITGGFQPMNPTNREKIRGLIDGITAQVNTNLGGAIMTAIEQITNLKNSHAKLLPFEVILLTDGHRTIGAKLPFTINQTIEMMKIVAFAINVFSIGDDIDAKFLQIVADSSAGGTYSHITIATLPERLGELISRVRNRVGSRTILSVSANPGVRISKWFGSNITTGVSKKEVKLICGNLYAGTQKKFMFVFSVRNLTPKEKQELIDGEIQILCDISVEYVNNDGALQGDIKQCALNRVRETALPHDGTECALLELQWIYKDIISNVTELCDDNKIKEAIEYLDQQIFLFAPDFNSDEVLKLYDLLLKQLEHTRENILDKQVYTRERNAIIQSISTSYSSITDDQKKESEIATKEVKKYVDHYTKF